MYDDFVKRLRDASGDVRDTLWWEAADAIEELEYALLLMVLQYCTTDDGLLFHEFMSAGENAFAVLGLDNGQQEAPLWYKMDRMMQSASERISVKTAPKEET
jgi:hypothetical protein